MQVDDQLGFAIQNRNRNCQFWSLRYYVCHSLLFVPPLEEPQDLAIEAKLQANHGVEFQKIDA